MVGTIQHRFGRRTCRWRAGSMSPRLSVKLIIVYFAPFNFSFLLIIPSFAVLNFVFKNIIKLHPLYYKSLIPQIYFQIKYMNRISELFIHFYTCVFQLCLGHQPHLVFSISAEISFKVKIVQFYVELPAS